MNSWAMGIVGKKPVSKLGKFPQQQGQKKYFEKQST